MNSLTAFYMFIAAKQALVGLSKFVREPRPHSASIYSPPWLSSAFLRSKL